MKALILIALLLFLGSPLAAQDEARQLTGSCNARRWQGVCPAGAAIRSGHRGEPGYPQRGAPLPAWLRHGRARGLYPAGPLADAGTLPGHQRTAWGRTVSSSV